MKTKKPTPKGIGPETTKTFGHGPQRSPVLLPITSADLTNMEARLTRRIAAQAGTIQEQLKQMAKTLEQILADAAKEDTHEESTRTLLEGVREQVAEALEGVTIAPEAQAKLNKVFDALDDHNEKVSAALTGDTPEQSP